MPSADAQLCPKCGSPLNGGDPSVPCPACLMKLGLESWTGGGSGINVDPAATPTQASPSFATPSPEELAGLFPQLQIIELIGQGGMGAVYKARQTNLDRIVALKIIRPDVEEQAGFDERFRREAKTLARLNHPNIVTVHDFGQSGGLYFLIMEYVDGVNLRQSLRKDHLQPTEALAIIPSICDALQYAHEEGVVHRDIKPENILLDKKGRVKIADFGLAKIVGISDESKQLTRSRQMMGTWHYMAPEQMQGTRDVDHRADIYSLGVVLYEMLTGELPIGRFAPPSQKVKIDVRLDQVVLRTLESDPALRYQQVSEVRTDLTSVSSANAQASDPTRIQSRQPAAILPDSESGRKREFSLPQKITMGLGMFVCLLMVLMPPWHLTFEEGETQTFYRFLFFPPTGNFVTNNGASWVLSQSIEWGLLLLELVLAGAITAGACWLLAPSESVRTDSKKPRNAMSAKEIAHSPGMCLVVTGCMNWVLMAILFTLMAIAKVRQGSNVPDVTVSGDYFLLVPAILTVPLSGFVVLAGLKLRQLQSPGMVRFGSILAMLLTPGNLLGLPIGIWSLVTLSDKRVRAEMYGPEDLDAPRTSRKAILGAVWMGLIPLTLILVAPAVTVSDRTVNAPTPEQSQKILIGVMAILSIPYLSVIGTPVLGLLALSDIRNNPGRITGRTLAFVDAIFLPMLVFNGLLVWLLYSIIKDMAPQAGIAVIGSTCLIVCGTLTWTLVRRAWRAVTASDRSTALPPEESATAHPRSSELPSTSAAKATYISSIVMMTVSFFVVTAGVVLFGLAFLLHEPGTHEFWGWMGGAFGCFAGGIGSFIGCWNSYRQIEGAPDLMSSPMWTWLDRLMLIYGLIGVILLMAGVFSWSRSHSVTGQSLCLLGGISLLQGLGFSAYRAMVRRAS